MSVILWIYCTPSWFFSYPWNSFEGPWNPLIMTIKIRIKYVRVKPVSCRMWDVCNIRSASGSIWSGPFYTDHRFGGARAPKAPPWLRAWDPVWLHAVQQEVPVSFLKEHLSSCPTCYCRQATVWMHPSTSFWLPQASTMFLLITFKHCFVWILISCINILLKCPTDYLAHFYYCW